MSRLEVIHLLPDIVPAQNTRVITWKGSTEHLGPLTDSTPLHGELASMTCCGLYMLYIGCVGLITKRMSTIMNTNLNRCLIEQIFCYQFDWRYPATYGITLTDIDENPDKIAAIRRLIPYFFFDIIERTNGFFVSTPSIHDIVYIINLTRHLCGVENLSSVDTWVKSMIERLDLLAYRSENLFPVLQNYASRAEWEAAVRPIHGQPLPVEVLDCTTIVDKVNLANKAFLDLKKIDPSVNLLLKSPNELIADGFIGTPYREKQS